MMPVPGKRQIVGLLLAGAVLLAACAVALLPVAVADYIAPDRVSIRTERYSPGEADYHPGIYQYAIAWQGIPVATATIEVGPYDKLPNSQLRVTATAKTASGIDWLYRLRHRSESIFWKDSLRPVRMVMEQRENRKIRTRRVKFSEDGKVVAKLWKESKRESDITFTTENPVFDPISAAFLARSLPISQGKKFSFDVFNGKHRYLIDLDVQAEETIKFGGAKRKAYLVIPGVKKLTDSNGEKKLKSAKLWISTDNRHEVLRLESKVWIGRVTAQLERFTPEPSNAPAPTTETAMQAKL